MAEWTAEQAMGYLAVSRATLYGLVKRGLLVKHQRSVGQGVGGRRTYFDAAEVKTLRGQESVAAVGDQVSRAQIEQVLTTQLQVVRIATESGGLSAPAAYAVRQALWSVGNTLGINLVTGDEEAPATRPAKRGKAR